MDATRRSRPNAARKLAWPVATLLILTAVPIVLAAPPASADCISAGCPTPVPLPAGAFHFPVGARWQYQLQAARNSSGTACLYPSTGGINTALTGTSFATGQTVVPTVFDIDFQTDGFCTGGAISPAKTAARRELHPPGAHAPRETEAGREGKIPADI